MTRRALKKTFCNPPGSPVFANPTRSFLRELVDFTKAIIGIGGPHLTANDLPLLPVHHILEEMTAQQNSITWLGHASFFLRLDGKNILIDPFLSPRAASIQPFGTPRLRPAALTVEQLPSIDMVLITHAHYDHCDRAALKKLAALQSVRAFVPEGMRPLLIGWGFTEVTEMPWHLTITSGSISITSVPAIHHSRRSIFDYNSMHWCGFIIAGSAARVYMAGDTAYGPIFKEIGHQYGPCDLGLVPIGGYGANDHLRSVHATPEDACAIGADMRCASLIGMHWGALNITSEPALEPPQRFHAAASAYGYSSHTARTLHLGQTHSL